MSNLGFFIGQVLENSPEGRSVATVARKIRKACPELRRKNYLRLKNDVVVLLLGMREDGLLERRKGDFCLVKGDISLYYNKFH